MVPKIINVNLSRHHTAAVPGGALVSVLSLTRVATSKNIISLFPTDSAKIILKFSTKNNFRVYMVTLQKYPK